MNRKELREIRRRVRPDRNNIQRIYGCYINSQREIIAEIEESFGLLGTEEQEKYTALLKKALSGTLGKNLMDLNFSTQQVVDGDEHRLLSALRRTRVDDPVVRRQFFRCVADNLDMGDSNYVVLIACDAYDVPHFGKDGQRDEEDREVFDYLLCSVCPVKTAKPVLRFSSEENRFENLSLSQIVGTPELGFMFPAFDDRSANIYSALFYSRDTKGIHSDFIDAVFKTEVPLSAGQQRSAFSAAMTEVLDSDCSLEMVQAVHGQLRERIEQHRESNDPEPLTMTYAEVEEMLENGGMDESLRGSFLKSCDSQFGKDHLLSPENLMDSKKFEIKTESVTVKVDPDFSSLVKTQVIDGRKYILIPADGAVEVNGISVNL